ncbi:GTP cyclohydrolase I [Kitasatospora sp. NPDC050463]|uniref:GTP cyclohydrolase I n=1 Tax=Kitasatospora sp. NPDC050463 TaxID=3155786 RepID=UPI0033EDC4C3
MTPIPSPARPRVDTHRVESLTRELLIALGEDPEREGLADTPRRVAAWWTEFLDRDPGTLGTTFAHATTTDDFFLVRDIEVWSVCEHHLLPFRLKVAIAHVPAARVRGLSKLVRQLRVHANALQLQERVVRDVAHDIAKASGTDDVAVIAVGEHLCMSTRGGEAAPARTVSSCRPGRTASDSELAARIDRWVLSPVL